jgi:hypothetical protein
MYKRISHNIVEEHFDHPMAIDLKDKLSNPMDPTPPKMKSSKSGMWMSTNNDISTLVGHIRNYIVSEIGSAEDVEYVKNQVLTDVTRIGETISKHYSSEISDAVLTHLTGVVTSLVSLLGAAKASKDLEPYKAIVLSHVDSLATALGSANPNKWNRIAVKEYLTQYVVALAEQIGARLAMDWAADEAAATKANNIMFNGPISSGSLEGKPDFEHVYCSGLVGHSWY